MVIYFSEIYRYSVYIIYDISKPKDRNLISIPNLGTSAKYGYILTKLIDIPYSEA